MSGPNGASLRWRTGGSWSSGCFHSSSPVLLGAKGRVKKTRQVRRGRGRRESKPAVEPTYRCQFDDQDIRHRYVSDTSSPSENPERDGVHESKTVFGPTRQGHRAEPRTGRSARRGWLPMTRNRESGYGHTERHSTFGSHQGFECPLDSRILRNPRRNTVCQHSAHSARPVARRVHHTRRSKLVNSSSDESRWNVAWEALSPPMTRQLFGVVGPSKRSSECIEAVQTYPKTCVGLVS